MIVHAPRGKVVLVKAQHRTAIADFVSASADRYGKLQSLDLTPLIMTEGGNLNLAKSVRQPAGGFSLTIPDQPAKGVNFIETVYGLVEPMDYVEIRLAHGTGGLKVVMRGFVSQVTRSESMQSGRPQRVVNIQGQDMGKIWQIIQLYYITNSVLGQYVITALAYFQKYVPKEEAKILPASQFVGDVLKYIINPFLGALNALSEPTDQDMAKIVTAWTPLVSIAGDVSPYAIDAFQDVSIYQMMARTLDVGPFNEMYTEDTETGVNLVVRPVPFKYLFGGYIQAGAKADTLTLSSVDLESLTVFRSDYHVANFFWVHAPQWDMFNNLTQLESANQYGTATDFMLTNYLNTQESVYGLRKMEVESLLVPDGYLATDAGKADQQKGQQDSEGAWLAARRKTLADLNKDAVIFEEGTMVLKGNEKVKAGMILTLTRGMGSAEAMDCYAHTVSHEFVPYTGLFRTRVQFDRGTGWARRANAHQPLYTQETDAGGALAGP